MTIRRLTDTLYLVLDEHHTLCATASTEVEAQAKASALVEGGVR